MELKNIFQMSYDHGRLDDLDIILKCRAFPIEKETDNLDIDLGTNYPVTCPIFHQDSAGDDMDLVNTVNSPRKEDTDFKAIFVEDRNIINQAVKTNRNIHKNVKKSEELCKVHVSACCPKTSSAGMDNMPIKVSLVYKFIIHVATESHDNKCSDYVRNDLDKKISCNPLDRSGHVPKEKRKQCKQKKRVLTFASTRLDLTATKWILGCFVIFYFLVSSVAGVVAECSKGTSESSIKAFSEGQNILLKCLINCDNDGCRGGVRKWEGGPNRTILTFGNVSLYPATYQPKNQTFDLMMINPNNETFNSTYTCHQKFYCIGKYLPDLPVEPTNWTILRNHDEKTLIEVEINGIYPLPMIHAMLGMLNLSSLVDINPMKSGVLYNCRILLPNKQDFCSYNDSLGISYQLPGVQKFIFNDMVTLHMCQRVTSDVLGPVLGTVGGVVFLLGFVYYIYKLMRRAKDPNYQAACGEMDTENQEQRQTH